MTLQEVENQEREFSLAERKSQAYATSMMIPQHLRDLGSMMILNQMSKDYGLPALMLAQNIFMVKGKVGMSGQLVIALINKSKMYDRDLDWEEREKPWGVRAIAYKKGEKVSGLWVDEKMIVDNGWYKNENWKTNKALMARYRSATYFGRLNCPAILMGLQTDDELTDVQNNEENVGEDINNALIEGSNMPSSETKKEINTPSLEEAILEEREPPVSFMLVDEEGKVEDVLEEVVEKEEKEEKEEELEFMKPTVPKRASKKVVSNYVHFLKAGVRRAHLVMFVRHFELNDDNIEEFLENLPERVDAFYKAIPTLTRGEILQ